jgi:hemerythrin
MKTQADLDKSHLDLITRLNNLAFLDDGRPDPIELNEVRIVWDHECEEEVQLMSEAEFPYLHAHMLAHIIISKYFLRIDSESSNAFLIVNLITEIAHHIETYDQQFLDYLKTRNK